MNIKRWKKSSSDKHIKVCWYRLKRDWGMRIMAVSMATIPVIKGESAKQMLSFLDAPTITRKMIEERKKETRGITIRRIR